MGIYKEAIAKAEQEKLVELERISQLKEKRIIDEQQKLEEMNQTYTEKLEKIENENIITLEEINKLKEKRIEEEQKEKEELDQHYKEKIENEKQRRIAKKELKKVKAEEAKRLELE